MHKPEKEFVKYLKIGAIETQFAIYGIEARLTRNGKKYLYLRLGDKTGVLTTMRFTENPEEVDNGLRNYHAGQIVMVKGTVEEYQGKLNIKINSPITDSLVPCNESEYNISDFRRVTDKNISSMLNEIKEKAKNLKNPYLKQICESFLNDEKFVKEFSSAPAAQSMHHNYIGGLLEHTLNVINLCDLICNFYTNIDQEMLFCGAFLHDIGKLQSYSWGGPAIEWTEKADLIGHVILGDTILKNKIKEIDSFPEELQLRLSHLILTHHGKKAEGVGSPVDPKTPEAVILHYADYLDSQARMVTQNIITEVSPSES